MLSYNIELREISQKLRQEMTAPERRLWSRLRRKQILDVQFYRQKPIGNYIVDFYAPAARVVVEVDGAQHLEQKNIDKDLQRTDYLNSIGLTVIRFDNAQIMKQIDDVVAEIYRIVAKKIPPTPPFAKGGEEP